MSKSFIGSSSCFIHDGMLKLRVWISSFHKVFPTIIFTKSRQTCCVCFENIWNEITDGMKSDGMNRSFKLAWSVMKQERL